MSNDELSSDEQAPHETAHLRAAAMKPERSGPLVDVKVLDLTQALAGPFCTAVLGDLGADVIKVEAPRGDMARFIPPFTAGDDDHHFGGYFASVNRNKRSIALDLKEPADREALLRLVDEADVVVENFKAGVMDRLDLSYETLHARRPSLVYAAIRGFGDPRTGESPYSEWPAFDVVAQSMGGLISYTGDPEGPRVSAGPSVGDLYPATMMVVGILAALHHSRRTGEGQFVDVGMSDAVMALCESLTWRYSYTGEVQAPRGSAHPSIAPFEVYPTADGFCSIAAPTPGQWEYVCGVIDRPDLVTDDRTSNTRRRVQNRPFLNEIMNAWTSQRTTAEIVELLGGHVPVGPVNDAPALFDSEHVAAREMLVAVDHPGSERQVVLPNSPVKFTATPTGIHRRPPILDEHAGEGFES